MFPRPTPGASCRGATSERCMQQRPLSTPRRSSAIDLRTHRVADAANGLDHAATELAAQMVNMDFDRVAQDVAVLPAQGVLEASPRQHAALAAQEGLEQ